MGEVFMKDLSILWYFSKKTGVNAVSCLLHIFKTSRTLSEAILKNVMKQTDIKRIYINFFLVTW